MPGPHTDKRVCRLAGQRYYEEVMLAVLDQTFTAALDRHFTEDLEHSELIRPGRWKRRSTFQRAREAAVVPIRRFL
ncbi:hypothetical protein GCM10009837_69110 [Streptomyces durmitorensis]